jgi:hypothetical protein
VKAKRYRAKPVPARVHPKRIRTAVADCELPVECATLWPDSGIGSAKFGLSWPVPGAPSVHTT